MKYSKLLTNGLFVVSSLGLASAVFADTAPVVNAPVVNAYQYENVPSNNLQQGQSMAQRLNQLQQKMENEQRLNLPAQLQQLQQQVQSLTGQVQVQAHELAQLKQQLQSQKKGGLNSPLTKPALPPTASTNQTKPERAPNLAAPTQTKLQNTRKDNFLSDQDAYESAYKLITQNNYQGALAAMQSYLKQFPNGRYISNAHYWSGEIYLTQNNDRMAATEFETVVNQYPRSNKISDAMLKLGFIYYDNGQLNKSKVQLEQVMKKYPNTTVAKLAKNRLQDINQQINASQTNQASNQNSRNS